MAEQLRVDKFLFFTRFFKTRGLATTAVTGGHVARDGERMKPAHPVRVGDRLTITRDRYSYEIDVLALPQRRGPASEAQACYQETAQSAEARAALREALHSDRMHMPRTEGRPDKRTRRKIRAFRERD